MGREVESFEGPRGVGGLWFVIGIWDAVGLHGREGDAVAKCRLSEMVVWHRASFVFTT